MHGSGCTVSQDTVFLLYLCTLSHNAVPQPTSSLTLTHSLAASLLCSSTTHGVRILAAAHGHSNSNGVWLLISHLRVYVSSLISPVSVSSTLSRLPTRQSGLCLSLSLYHFTTCRPRPQTTTTMQQHPPKTSPYHSLIGRAG